MEKENKEVKRKYKGLKSIILFDVFIALLLILLMNCTYDSKTSTVIMFGKTIYTADNTAETGKVIVSYVDVNGDKIREDDIYTGTLGEEYSVERKEISGYLNYGKDPINKKGNYDSKDTYVEFSYIVLDIDYNLTSVDDDFYTVTVLKDRLDEPKEYKFVIESYDENGKPLTESEFKVTRPNTSIVRSGKDYTGKFVIGSLIVDEEGIEKFIISQTKAKEGYDPLEKDITVEITKTFDTDNNEYVVKAKINEVDTVSVIVNEETQEIIVKIEKRNDEIETEPETEKETEKTTTGVVTGDKIIMVVVVLAVAIVVNVIAIIMMKKNNKKDSKEE